MSLSIDILKAWRAAGYGEDLSKASIENLADIAAQVAERILGQEIRELELILEEEDENSTENWNG